jgi:hypothetical protein
MKPHVSHNVLRRALLLEGAIELNLSVDLFQPCRVKILDVPQSGSAGNLTSARNRSGQYQRARSMPTQPRTASQVAARARLTTLSAGWRGLTDAQRAAWNAFANSFSVTNTLGQTIFLTGHQCYVKVNTVNTLNGDATVAAPPALPSFLAATTTGLTAAAGTPAIDVAGSSPAGGTKFMFYASPQLSAGVTFNGDYRWLKTMTTATSSKFSLLTEYVAKFGALIAGKRVFVRVVQSQAGMQDNGTLYTAIVAA